MNVQVNVKLVGRRKVQLRAQTPPFVNGAQIFIKKATMPRAFVLSFVEAGNTRCNIVRQPAVYVEINPCSIVSSVCAFDACAKLLRWFFAVKVNGSACRISSEQSALGALQYFYPFHIKQTKI